MTEPSNLRDAADVLGDILRADTAQDAAAIIEADRAAVEAATIAKVVREIVAKVRGAMMRGYPLPPGNERCEHGTQRHQDCIACYDDALHEALEKIEQEWKQ